MSRLPQRLSHVLEDGRITPDEVAVIQAELIEDGRLDLTDVRFLVELLSGAREVCPEFDALFFPVLRSVLLEDGQIDQSEQYYLLKMLYSDGEIRPSELRFLDQLAEEADRLPPEFDAMLREAKAAHPTAWSVGGAVSAHV